MYLLLVLYFVYLYDKVNKNFLMIFLNGVYRIMEFNVLNLKWIREPKNYILTKEKIEIITEPYTDLWQRTYYHFRNDNAPLL